MRAPKERFATLVIVLGLSAGAASASCPGFGDERGRPAVEIPADPTWLNSIGSLMSFYCVDCHGARPADPSLAFFRVDTYYDEGSALGVYSQRMRHLSRITDPGRPMPPPPRPGLTPDEVAGFRRWIENGAPYDDGTGDAIGAFPPKRCDPGTAGGCACAGGYYGTQTCLDDGTYGDCDCTGGGEPGGPTALADVASQVFRPSCALLGCHTAGAIYPDLQETSGLRSRLLAPSRQEPGMSLVEPGSPENSYLYLKTGANFSSLGLGSGEPMPPALAPGLTPWQRQLLASWIVAGAQE